MNRLPYQLTNSPCSRRQAIFRALVSSGIACSASGSFGAEGNAAPADRSETLRRPLLGLSSHSCGQAWAALEKRSSSVRFEDTASFLRYAQSMGAQAVQCPLRPLTSEAARAVRGTTDDSGVLFEGEIEVSQESLGSSRFETTVGLLRAAGATVARTAMLQGRRYEVFGTRGEFDQFRADARRALEKVNPVLRKHGLRLAVENHKDWLAAELADLLRGLGSEWIGACLDLGNNLALLETSELVTEILAPFTLTVHVKDMATQDMEEGFLLSEVPLGQGVLNLPALISALNRARRHLVFQLEIITRNPLPVPCLLPQYWETLREVKAAQLAVMLLGVRRGPRRPLPTVRGLTTAELLALEEQNNSHSLQFGHQHLGF